MEALVIIVVLLALGFWHARNKEACDQAERLRNERWHVANEAEQDAAEAELEDAVRHLLAIHVEQHERTLLTKRRQTTFNDDYGREDRSRWDQELRYFIDKVCHPSILEFYKGRYEREDIAYIVAGVDLEQLLEARGGSAELAEYVADMTGVNFEKLVAERLASAGADVCFTPVTGDQGADLIVRHNGETIVVQCKRSASTVGNKAVQEAFAGRTFHDANQAWVVSDAPFSRQARQLANSLSVRLIDFGHVEDAL